MLLLLASLAHADVPPADTEGCSDKSAGQSCKTDAGTSGACEKDTCSRLDYSSGTPPGTITYDCLKCVEGASATKCGVVDGTATLPLVLTAILATLGLRRR